MYEKYVLQGFTKLNLQVNPRFLLIHIILKSYKNIFWFLLLSIVLFVPWINKIRHSRFEMYPAIIMPSGHYQVQVADSVTYTTLELFAYDKSSNEPLPLNHIEFMNGIPIQYLGPIAMHEFGLNPKDNVLQFLKMHIVEKSKSSSEDIVHTKKWIRSRLNEQGMLNSSLLVRKYENHFALNASHGLKKILIDEKVYSLN